MPLEDFIAKFDASSEIDRARLAAYIDGEGTIYINRHRRSGKIKTMRYMLSVVVTNTSLPLLAWLQSTFGGSVYAKRFERYEGLSNRPCHTWHVNERQAEHILRCCLQYFIIKREQAVIGLAFRDLMNQGSKGTKLTSEVLQRRDALRTQIHLLNSPAAAEIEQRAEKEA